MQLFPPAKTWAALEESLPEVDVAELRILLAEPRIPEAELEADEVDADSEATELASVEEADAESDADAESEAMELDWVPEAAPAEEAMLAEIRL